MFTLLICPLWNVYQQALIGPMRMRKKPETDKNWIMFACLYPIDTGCWSRDKFENRV